MLRHKVLTFLLMLFIPVSIMANDGTYAWDLNSEPDVDGYRIYFRETSGGENIFFFNIDHPNNSLTVLDIPDGYYVIRAYDTEGNESADSNEILVAKHYYNTIRYDYESTGRLLYKGEHIDYNADVDDINWEITKYYYSGEYLSHIRIRTTSWTNRAVGW